MTQCPFTYKRNVNQRWHSDEINVHHHRTVIATASAPSAAPPNADDEIYEKFCGAHTYESHSRPHLFSNHNNVQVDSGNTSSLWHSVHSPVPGMSNDAALMKLTRVPRSPPKWLTPTMKYVINSLRCTLMKAIPGLICSAITTRSNRHIQKLWLCLTSRPTSCILRYNFHGWHVKPWSIDKRSQTMKHYSQWSSLSSTSLKWRRFRGWFE